MSNSQNDEITKFNKYKYLFSQYQRYFEAPYSNTKSFIKDYESIRDNFLKYKPYYEHSTKDYRKNSSYIILGNQSYEFITPNKFSELMTKTEISPNEKLILNNSYIGTEFSWKLNSKLRESKNLTEDELLIKKVLQNVINKNVLSDNYLCKKFTHFDYIQKVFGINPNNLDDTQLENQIEKHIGEIKEEKGFMSCSMTNNQVIDGECLLKVYVHSGTKAFITDNIKETEVIFDCNTKYLLIKCEVNSQKKTRIILHILIVRLRDD
jgi:hypothetical protein